ncbi:hypothetical protein CA13_18100 [Planctomycetes bacterium CA13]|uniref:Uncharacterized protein n=2 Tax=Novipirellula herctigrandis TaxID=2527986 RepID=A0A5C5YZC3_9BACT|nr:hypothetical protein CA13_18100 [Planctomycetes bacterium CA13]
MKPTMLFALILTSVVSLPATRVSAQVPFPGPRYTREQIQAQQKRHEEQRKLAEAKYQEQLQQAELLGKDIKLTILMDSASVRVPADISKQIEAFEAGQRELDGWKRQWSQLERREREARKKALEEREEAEGKVENTVTRGGWGSALHSVNGLLPGHIISEQKAIKEIGPRPIVPSAPQRPTQPRMTLLFENTSDQMRRLYPSTSNGRPHHSTKWKYSADGTHGIHSGTSGIFHDSEFSVDLAPGETYRIPLNRPASKFPLYFVKPGTHRFAVTYTTGITSSQFSVFHVPELEEDAMVIESLPVEFTVEFEEASNEKQSKHTS